MIRSFFAKLIVLTVTLQLLSGASLSANQKQPKKKKRRPNPAYAKITDDPQFSRALLIGDSISIGYTVAVRQELKGKVNLHRIPTNGGPTSRGLENIDRWLGDKKWDVIHFNWGLHDLKYLDKKKQVPLDQYEKNLQTLVKRLKQTNAKLIWCNTTPVPLGVSPPRKNEDVLEYNQVAGKVMKEHGIPTNNLYSFAQKRLKKIQRPRNVHFTPEGSKILAKPVARAILDALQNK